MVLEHAELTETERVQLLAVRDSAADIARKSQARSADYGRMHRWGGGAVLALGGVAAASAFTDWASRPLTAMVVLASTVLAAFVHQADPSLKRQQYSDLAATAGALEEACDLTLKGAHLEDWPVSTMLNVLPRLRALDRSDLYGSEASVAAPWNRPSREIAAPAPPTTHSART